MKNNLFSCLFFFSLLSLNSCDDGFACSCDKACSVGAEGEISCSLDAKALEKRKSKFQALFFSNAEKVEEIQEGYQFTFKDEGKLNDQLFEFILTEKKCCPFFQYDIKILPYNAGIEFSITGDERVKAFLETLIKTPLAGD